MDMASAAKDVVGIMINENGPWKTKSALMSWIRGGIRRGLWNKSPIKLGFLNKHRKQIKNPNPRGNKPLVWGAMCSLCGVEKVIAQIEVDHKKGGHSLKDIPDIQKFVENIVLVSEDDLQLVCKDCHKVKNHSEKKGISFTDAMIEKRCIAIMKAKQDLQFITERGIIAASNAAKRRIQVMEILSKESV